MDSPSPSGDGRLTAAEREYIVQALERTGEELIASVRNLSPAQWTFKPAGAEPGDDVWSIAECCNHIGGTEIRFLKMIRRALIEDPARGAAVQGKEKLLRKAVPNRTVRVKVPVAIPPFGHVETPEDFVRHFRETREATIEFVKSTQDPLHHRVTPHFTLGDFDGAQWLEMVAEHGSRHRAQIEEVKACAGFPAN